MKSLFTVLSHEHRVMTRNPFAIAVWAVLLLTGISSIGLGYHTISTRQNQIDSIDAAYHRDVANAIKKFTDTSTAEKKVQAAYAGMAEMINFRIPQHAILRPRPLSVLALGLSDVVPFHREIKETVSFTDAPEVPVTNPMKLLEGNFDFTFVLIYILPVFMIGLGFDVYYNEKASGTLALLQVQNISMRNLIIYKILYRFLFFIALVLVLNTIGLIASAYKGPVRWEDFAYWNIICFLYVLLWQTLVAIIVFLKRTSGITAMWLSGLWIFLLIIFPCSCTLFVHARYPESLREELSSVDRDIGEEVWSMPPRVLADSFYFHNPQYLAYSNPVRDTQQLSAVFIAGYYDLKARRVLPYVLSLQKFNENRNALLKRLSVWNPCMVAQHHLDHIAGTDRARYEQFTRQADIFQKQWQRFLYQYQIAEKYLTPGDFKDFPVFRE